MKTDNEWEKRKRKARKENLVVYNGKSADGWYQRFCEQVKENERLREENKRLRELLEEALVYSHFYFQMPATLVAAIKKEVGDE